MVRATKKAPVAVVKEMEDSPTVTQSRTRRTPKPNPKYTNESVIATPKLETDTPGSSDLDDKPVEVKTAKSAKKPAETPKAKVTAKSKTPVVVKKQKLDYDDDDGEDTEDADEKPDEKPPTRATRSKLADKDMLKVGDESVAIVDVSSIISKSPIAKPDSPKPSRAATRKRPVQEDSPVVEDQSKKKKEEESKSMITARKSYIPSPGQVKKEDVKKEEIEVKKEVAKTPALPMKTRRNAVETRPEPETKKQKVEEIKQEPKKLPVLRKSDTLGKDSPTMKVIASSPIKSPVLPTRVVNNNNNLKTVIAGNAKPVPRILNSMVTPKGKQSPNVKLSGAEGDKKVFSIDLTDDSIKIIGSPGKTPVAVKENIANNKPQLVLKSKLETELIRMKASANFARRSLVPSATNRVVPTNANAGARRITKFESWYVIDVKNLEPTPFRHAHNFSLITLGNNIKEVELPSTKWDFRVTLQRRRENNDDELYTGEVNDKTNEAANMEPSSILFKRNQRENNKISIDRSLMLKQNNYTITMNGKQCKLIGAPDDIKSLEDFENLLSIIDSCSLDHSCVELVTNHDVITIS